MIHMHVYNMYVVIEVTMHAYNDELYSNMQYYCEEGMIDVYMVSVFDFGCKIGNKYFSTAKISIIISGNILF